MNLLRKISESSEYLINRGIGRVDVAVILGTGLGSRFINALSVILEIPYGDIPHFPEATVEFHHGKLIYGEVEGKKVLAFNGRFHFYEGYSLQEVSYPVRIARSLNAGYLLISNAAGCMNLDWKKGDLMLVDDHINLQMTSPLVGVNYDELGPRFTDMSQPYSQDINEALLEIAQAKGIKLRLGVYVGVIGPQLETRAEYRFLRIAGADAVGMSTVPEVIAANHAGLPCAAISVLTDMCDPDSLHPVNIQDIIETAGKAEKTLTDLFIRVIAR